MQRHTLQRRRVNVDLTKAKAQITSLFGGAGQPAAKGKAKSLHHRRGSSGGGGDGDAANEQREITVFVALNNMRLSARHVLTLKVHLDREFESLFLADDDDGGNGDGAAAAAAAAAAALSTRRVRHCLDDLATSADTFNRLADAGVAALTSQLRATFLDKLLQQTLLAATYDKTTERDFAAAEVAETEATRFAHTITNQLAALRPLLDEENGDALVRAMAAVVTARVESAALGKRFSFWGGLQFDKDVRAVCTAFANAAAGTVRDHFARLVQMASILQLVHCDEVDDYWTGGDGASGNGDGGDAAAPLTAADVRRVLKLRTDFSASDIAKLAL
jgi:hypothetical protein